MPPPPPPLTVNRGFMSALLDEDAPCLAPGIAVTEGSRCALIALRLDEPIPRSISGAKFEFGHALVGTKTSAVVHFAFSFSGFLTFHALLNPNNSIVQAVLAIMVDTGNYMFLAWYSDHAALAFLAPMDRESLSGLKANLPRLCKSRTTEAQYRSAFIHFEKDPQPPGVMLSWVCRDEMSALEPQRDPIVLTAA